MEQAGRGNESSRLAVVLIKNPVKDFGQRLAGPHQSYKTGLNEVSNLLILLFIQRLKFCNSRIGINKTVYVTY